MALLPPLAAARPGRRRRRALHLGGGGGGGRARLADEHSGGDAEATPGQQVATAN